MDNETYRNICCILTDIQNNTYKTTHAKQHIQNNTCKTTHAKQHMQNNTYKTTHAKQHMQNNTHKTAHAKQHIQSVNKIYSILILKHVTYSNHCLLKMGNVVSNKIVKNTSRKIVW